VVADTAIIDDSVFRSATTGGQTSTALDLRASGTLHTVSLAHVTAHVGTDWGLASALPSGYVGAAIHLGGTIEQLVLVNTVLAFAGGGRADAARWTGLDLTDMAAAPREVTARGNVWSIPVLADGGLPIWPAADASLIRCTDDPEFGQVRQEAALDNAFAYQCPALTTPTATWSIGSNRAITGAPTATSSDRPPRAPAERGPGC
jgi:hypothetical protein